MRQYRKKTHGFADARRLTGAEIIALELMDRKALAWKRDLATPEDFEEKDDGLLLVSMSSRAVGESQVLQNVVHSIKTFKKEWIAELQACRDKNPNATAKQLFDKVSRMLDERDLRQYMFRVGQKPSKWK